MPQATIRMLTRKSMPTEPNLSSRIRRLRNTFHDREGINQNHLYLFKLLAFFSLLPSIVYHVITRVSSPSASLRQKSTTPTDASLPLNEKHPSSFIHASLRK